MTTRRQRICDLLEEMLKSAEARDGKRVFKINDSLEPLIIQEQKRYRSLLGLDYDSCRQSCVLPFTLFPGLYDKMIADAKKRFSEIKKRY